jgi:hypothetical protein
VAGPRAFGGATRPNKGIVARSGVSRWVGCELIYNTALPEKSKLYKQTIISTYSKVHLREFFSGHVVIISLIVVDM